MSIKPVGQPEQQQIISDAPAKRTDLFTGRFGLSLPDIARNVNRSVVPALVLFALSTIPGAEGGPITFSSCITGCLAAPLLYLPTCIATCLPILGMPDP